MRRAAGILQHVNPGSCGPARIARFRGAAAATLLTDVPLSSPAEAQASTCGTGTQSAHPVRCDAFSNQTWAHSHGHRRSVHTSPSPPATQDSEDEATDVEADAGSASFMQRVFGPGSGYAKESFRNRWAMAVPAFATHLSIGSPWAWSVVSDSVSRDLGFVTAAADDWSLASCSAPLSVVFAMQGIMAAVAGKWQMRVGHRAAMAVSALCFGGGLVVGAAGIATHQLWMLYLGYGILAGTGVGVAYTPPVQALIEWFPDRKGLASALAIAGFGSGALLFAPLMSHLQSIFATMPTYVGPVGSVATETIDGRLYAKVDGVSTEVVFANASDIARLPYDGLMEGLYAVGTGNTGVAGALAVCGLMYTGIMFTSAMTMLRPHANYVPDGMEVEAPVAAVDDDADKSPATDLAPAGNVDVSTVMKTPQFFTLGTVFFCLASGGMGLFSVAKPLMTEVFTSSLPSIVTSAFAGMFVQALAFGNLSGRIGWGALSDNIGRRNTFLMFAMGSVPLYLSMPYFVEQVVDTGAALPLYAFVGSTVLAVSFMGGVYAILPAYEADTFGAKYVGPIHGRMLLWSSLASFVGPAILQTLRSGSEREAMDALLTKINSDAFQERFGDDMENVTTLIDAKTVTIPKLMELCPPGTADPSPFIYNSTLYTMAGLATVASVVQLTMRPVNPKYFEKVEQE